MKKLFLLDAYALIYRAYYALIRAPRVTSKGLNTSAVFGFCNTLEEILRKEEPTHIAVCFDPAGGRTFRHERYEAYKAQRDKQPEDITASIPYIKRILAAYRIPAIEIEGYEADDVIGTLARQAEAEGFETYMMTPDKDYGQLVTEHTRMYRPSLRGEGFEVRGPAEVCSRYGISNPRQVIDLLALEGDVSDNIPGCPGVGEKTAAKLIAEWGSVENLLDHTAELKGALKRKIEENVEQIRESKWLVTIKTDVELGDVTPESLARQDVDVESLLAVYRELEFRTFIKRLGGEGAEVQPAARKAPAADGMGSLFDLEGEPESAPQAAVALSSLSTAGHRYTLADTAAATAAAVEELWGEARLGLATDSTGPEPMAAELTGLALSAGEGRGVYVDLTGLERREMLSMLEPLLGEAHGTLMATEDWKRDSLLLRREGIGLSTTYFDTAVAHYLLEPEMKHYTDALARNYLGYEMMAPAEKGHAPSGAERCERCCERADVALRLVRPLEDAVVAAGQSALLNDVELPMVRVLADMEWTGVRIDSGELAKLSGAYTARLEQMEQRVWELAGEHFNIGSPAQVGRVLFEKLKIDPEAKKTKKGSYSTTEEILEKHRADHEIVDLILKIRGLKKLLATYINALPAMVNRRTGKIHTSYNQTVTATGRISSTSPNLQNIPVRTADGREIRRAFIADNGDVMLSADYSQIELRLMAHMSGDPDMVEAFNSGADIHQATAAKIYHERLEEVTDEQRRNAKTANFGIIYGISAFGLSERLGISRAEAKSLIDGYFKTYPGVKEYIERCVTEARERQFVSTVMGRRRMLPDINSRSAVVRGFAERNAVNAPLQGSAADIIKVAMVRIASEMRSRRMRSRMIMQVHDELIFNVVPEELEAMRELVVRGMEGAFSGRVPMVVSMGVGRNWLEAH